MQYLSTPVSDSVEERAAVIHDTETVLKNLHVSCILSVTEP